MYVAYLLVNAIKVLIEDQQRDDDKYASNAMRIALEYTGTFTQSTHLHETTQFGLSRLLNTRLQIAVAVWLECFRR